VLDWHLSILKPVDTWLDVFQLIFMGSASSLDRCLGIIRYWLYPITAVKPESVEVVTTSSKLWFWELKSFSNSSIIGGAHKCEHLSIFLVCCHYCRLGFIGLLLVWSLTFFSSPFRPAVSICVAWCLAFFTLNIRFWFLWFIRSLSSTNSTLFTPFGMGSKCSFCIFHMFIIYYAMLGFFNDECY